jgi:hypothetical protein
MVAGMTSVTTAIVGFIFVCIIFPHLIRSRAQYFIAVGLVLVTMLLQGLATMIGNPTFGRFVSAMGIFMEAFAVILLILCAGGLSIGTFASEMGNAVEVLRRGGEEKEVIIPLPESMQKFKREKEEAPRVREEIGTPPPAKPRADDGPISMD